MRARKKAVKPENVDPLVDGVRLSVALAVEALQAHEETEHAGQPCEGERINCVAYLAYRLGLGEAQIKQALERATQFKSKEEKSNG